MILYSRLKMLLLRKIQKCFVYFFCLRITKTISNIFCLLLIFKHFATLECGGLSLLPLFLISAGQFVEVVRNVRRSVYAVEKISFFFSVFIRQFFIENFLLPLFLLYSGVFLKLKSVYFMFKKQVLMLKIGRNIPKSDNCKFFFHIVYLQTVIFNGLRRKSIRRV